ncbi:glycosyltransferase [Hyphomonas sp. WL0036]|uniref:glycosyltransferase n=1 Tax=Hyphomonas sediminis TaxID=2866160 RepID=UPI001C7E7D02|nr:glycosyltransferase [Hyphomonas sediminis]MBY9067724.1 glycosyltransferase [Hyphomonas sediminis]
MPAPLSIIIPSLNAAADLPLCLESLMSGLEAGLIREVILVDGGSGDTTVKIAEATGARVIIAGGNRGRQIAAGAGAARGEWLLIVPPPVALSRDWAERAGDHIDTRPGKAAYFELHYRSDDRRARKLEQSANRYAERQALILPEHGLLISRKLLSEVTGNNLPLDEAAIAKALGRDRLVGLSAEARASAAVLEQNGWKRSHTGGGYLRTLFAAKG